jgi:hypothetical protein
MPTHPPPLPVWRDRIRLADVVLVVTPSGGSEVTVHLVAPDGSRTSGQGAGLGHREGTMRAAVDAAIRALTPLTRGRLGLELRGVRSLRAFDALLVIVALIARPEPHLDPGVGTDTDPDGDGEEARYRLIGSVAAPGEDLVRGTVMAVLDAANRVMERYTENPAGERVAPTPEGDAPGP